MPVSIARQRANAGDEYLNTPDIQAIFSEIDNARGDARKLAAIEPKIERMRPYILPEGRPPVGLPVKLVNTFGAAMELATGEPYDVLIDESEEYTSMPHLRKTPEQIYKRMTKWCDNQYFESTEKLAEFLSEMLQEMEEDGNKMFVRNVEHAVFEFQKRDSIYNHVPYLNFNRLAIDSCGDRIFYIDENFDVRFIPNAVRAAVEFINNFQ